MDRFEEILMSQKEEDCQQFLTANEEILLSTFKKMVCVPKFRFGNEFVSDFVLFELSSIGYEITLVEIEPPTVRPFTKNGKYAKRLNDAIGQINDWFAWISENEDYFLRTLISAVNASTRWPRLYGCELALIRPNRRDVSLDAKIIIGRRNFLSEEDNKRRKAVYQTTNRTIEITHFDRLLDTYQRAVEKERAADNNVSVDELTTLSKSRFYEVRRLVATHENTSQVTLESLADDPESAVVYGVIKNKNTPYDILHNLVQRNDSDLNKILVQRTTLPAKLLLILFEENNDSLRRAILEHPNCPQEVLITASHSADRGHRRRAAQHPNLRDKSVLSELANDPEAFVRTGAAINPNLPASLISKLSDDSDKKVYIAARYQNINIPEGALIRGLENEGDWARSQIAKHPNLKNIDVLARLAEDESWWVRVALAENKNLPPSVKERLLTDADKRVRNAVRR